MLRPNLLLIMTDDAHVFHVLAMGASARPS